MRIRPGPETHTRAYVAARGGARAPLLPVLLVGPRFRSRAAESRAAGGGPGPAPRRRGVWARAVMTFAGGPGTSSQGCDLSPTQNPRLLRFGINASGVCSFSQEWNFSSTISGAFPKVRFTMTQTQPGASPPARPRRAPRHLPRPALPRALSSSASFRPTSLSPAFPPAPGRSIRQPLRPPYPPAPPVPIRQPLRPAANCLPSG